MTQEAIAGFLFDWGARTLMIVLRDKIVLEKGGDVDSSYELAMKTARDMILAISERQPVTMLQTGDAVRYFVGEILKAAQTIYDAPSASQEPVSGPPAAKPPRKATPKRTPPKSKPS